MKGRRRGLRFVLGALAVAGLLISAYLTWVHYMGVAPICVGGSGGCETVQTSSYATILWVPVAVVGLVGYSGLLFSALLRGEIGAYLGFLVALVGTFAVLAAGEDRPPSEDAGKRDDSAQAKGANSGHHEGHHAGGAGEEASTGGRDSVPEPAAGGEASWAASIAHGLALAASAFLAGLAPFAILVWLPASRQSGVGRDAIRSFGVLAGGLVLALAVAGVGELSSYAVRASGEPLGTGLFAQTLFSSRVGEVWLIRLALALLTAAAITAAGSGQTWEWGVATATGGLVLMSLTGLSHAAATDRVLPLLADWTHAVAAAVWMGGLVGFGGALCSGAYRSLAPDSRTTLRERAVRRFSAVATVAVVVLACTGLYAAVVHVANPQALLATPYGRALIAKLVVLILLLGVGASNHLLRGRGPTSRLVVVELLLALGLFVATGFLTSLPPASSA
ncbi:MAG TPA: CopD family protein [Rubrobacter sp.]|nr:CopD family protein [Rubrobacter sp.]